MKKFTLHSILISCFFVLFSSNPVYSLVLCTDEGGLGPGSVKDGGAVIIRESCLKGETTLRPFTFLPNGDFQEQVVKNKTSVIAGSSSLVVGSSHSENIGGNESKRVSGSRSILTGQNQTKTIGQDYELNIGRDHNRNIGRNFATIVSGNDSRRIAKELFFDVGSKFTIIAGDEIVIRTGQSSITMKKNGDISILGRKVNVRGRNAVNLKGKKIQNN